MSEPRKKRYTWTFLAACLALPLLALWAELAMTLVRSVQEHSGSARWPYAIGFFFTVLPVLALIVYRFQLVFDFFRSVKVGVVNLCLVGLGSILGVMWHQEDFNFPVPDEGIHELIAWEENDQPWSMEARRAFRNYLDFRKAHAHFTYQLSTALGLKTPPGTDLDFTIDQELIDDNVGRIQEQLPAVQARYGEEFAVGLRAQSESGLRVRQESSHIEEFQHEWDDVWWSLFVWSHRLDLIRVYKADWFGCLWAVVFLGVLSNTFRGGWRRLLRPKKWGFVVTHAGVLLIIVGGFWGRVTEQRGILQMNVGDASDRFMQYSGTEAPLARPKWFGGNADPFVIRLDSFRADHFEVLKVIYAEIAPEGGYKPEFPVDPPKYRVYEGQTLYFDYGPGTSAHLTSDRDGDKIPHLRLEVLEYLPQAEVGYDLRPRGPEDRLAVPIARVEVLDGSGRQEFEQLLLHHIPVPLVHGATGTRALYQQVEAVQDMHSALSESALERWGVLSLEGEGHVAEPGTEQDVYPGATFNIEAAGRTFAIEVLEAVPRLQLRRASDGSVFHEPPVEPIENQEPRMPAVHLRISLPDGEVEERWVLEEDFHQPDVRFPELAFDFRWDTWNAPALARWMIFQLPDQRCFVGELGDPNTLVELEQGESVPLDEEYSMRLVEAFPEAVMEEVPREISGADFFHPAAGAIRVMAYTPDAPEGEELLLSAAGDGAWKEVRYSGPEGEPRVALLNFYQDMDDLPFEWRSKLTIFAEDAEGKVSPVRTGEIRVNDYLFHDGYRMFQTDARADDPTYSGIGIVYDPGIETVILGLVMVAFGTIIVFLVTPIFTRKHRGV